MLSGGPSQTDVLSAITAGTVVQGHTSNPQGSVAKICIQAHPPLLGACDELIGVGACCLEVHNRYVAHLEGPPSGHLHHSPLLSSFHGICALQKEAHYLTAPITLAEFLPWHLHPPG